MRAVPAALAPSDHAEIYFSAGISYDFRLSREGLPSEPLLLIPASIAGSPGTCTGYWENNMGEKNDCSSSVRQSVVHRLLGGLLFLAVAAAPSAVNAGTPDLIVNEAALNP